MYNDNGNVQEQEATGVNLFDPVFQKLAKYS